MNRYGAALLLGISLVAPAVVRAESPPAPASRPGARDEPPQVSSQPSRIVLGRTRIVTITVGGLPGPGKPQAAVNVGSIERIEETQGGVVISYRPPATRFPQWLHLLAYREGRTLGIRLSMHGHTLLPVRTRRRSKLRVKLGEEVLGPFSTRRGRVKVPLLVAPGVDRAEVEAVDHTGLSTTKEIEIKRHAYRQVALLAVVEGSGARRRLLVAVAGEPGLELQANGEKLSLAPREGHWVGSWRPPAQATTAIVRARSGSDPGSSVETTVGLGPALPVEKVPTPAPRLVEATLQKPPAPSPSPSRRRFHVTAGVLAGVQHNLGAFVGPRFFGELGFDYQLPVGLLGLRAAAGYTWAGQSIAAAGEQAGAESTLGLLPVRVGLVYQLDLARLRRDGWARRLAPYLSAGYLLQVLRSTSSSPHFGEAGRTEYQSGAYGVGGLDVTLGPGALVVEVGYEWSHVENLELRVTAGGLLGAVGYRFRI